jgi:hypothetical protein
MRNSLHRIGPVEGRKGVAIVSGMKQRRRQDVIARCSRAYRSGVPKKELKLVAKCSKLVRKLLRCKQQVRACTCTVAVLCNERASLLCLISKGCSLF